MKERLDVLLVQRGMAPSREKAKAMIMAGEILVDGEREDKAGSMFPETVTITQKGRPLPYVSRGGLKLEKAMTHFGLELDGKICMDVGASTGGFTDCMLQNGAAKVYAVDVGHGQLDWKLRNHDRVVCMEKTNIRYVKPEDVGEHDWAMFFVPGYGWRYADLSYGGAAFARGDKAGWDFFFGNVDPLRIPVNDDFQAGFEVPKKHWRADPYDNQGGEAEYDDRGLTAGEYIYDLEPVSITF